MPDVVVITLGGTIAMTPAGSGGVAPALSGDDLLAAVPGLAGLNLGLRVLDFRQAPSASLGLPDLTALAGTIRTELAAGADAVVVTQGTDSIEETAYLLDLYHDGPQPLVVTGAMRNPALAGPDGPANLLAAIATAASPDARDHGCLVVLADEIHAARRVRKTHSTSPAAFRSPDGGPIGYLVEGRPWLLAKPAARHTVPPQTGRQPSVALLTAVLGDDGMLLDALTGRVDGLVLAAFGAGHVPHGLVTRLANLAAATPVVLASRTGAGPVLTGTYGFAGSERDLLDRGLIPAGFLHPLKARILLYALLAAGADHTAVADAFAAAGG